MRKCMSPGSFLNKMTAFARFHIRCVCVCVCVCVCFQKVFVSKGDNKDEFHPH